MNYNDASDYIHSPFVALRDTIDNGFSGGWGLHFQPSEEYWLIATTILNQEKVMKR